MAHSKVAPGSSAEKSKLADDEFVGSGMLESIVVSGSLASNVNVPLEAGSTFPAASLARTRTAYSPSTGRFAAGKSYDQSPAARSTSFQTSVELEKPEPSQ